jgi:CMP-N-acetylneuraminic acid synthetase
MSDTKLVALMPMKGESIRVENKNFKLLSGKPLFEYMLDTLVSLPIISEILVNTDSDVIQAQISQRYGDRIRVISRPTLLIGHDIPMNDIIYSDLKEYPHDTVFIQTHATNPFLSATSILDAINLYNKSVEHDLYDSVFSANRLQSRIYNSKLEPLNHDLAQLIKTQDLEPCFEENSCIYIFSGESFLNNNKNRIGKRPVIFEQDANSVEVIDIDTPEDWNHAERVLMMKLTHE